MSIQSDTNEQHLAAKKNPGGAKSRATDLSVSHESEK